MTTETCKEHGFPINEDGECSECKIENAILSYEDRNKHVYEIIDVMIELTDGKCFDNKRYANDM